MPTSPYFGGINAAQILAGGTGGGAATGGTRFITGPDGKQYQLVPEYTYGQRNGMDDEPSASISGYRLAEMIDGEGGGWLGSADLERYNGTNFDRYSADGQQYQGTDQWNGVGGGVGPWAALAMMLGGMGATVGGLGAGAAAAGAGAEAGAGAAAGAGAGGGVGSAAGFVGEGALSGIGAWDAALAGALPGELGAAGAAGAAGGSSGISGPGITTGANGATTFGVVDPSVAWGAGSGAGLLGTALKYGLPLAGALSGAKGTDNTQSQERRMDPRLDPYVFGGNGQQGLLDYARQVFQQSMTPERLAEADRVRGQGLGLLSRPLQTNGFNRFFPGR